MTKDEAIHKALKVLNCLNNGRAYETAWVKGAINACEEALEQQEVGDAEIKQMLDDIEWYQQEQRKLIDRIKALEQPAQSDVDLKLKQFSKNLIDNQIQDEHPLSSEQLWDLYETEQPAQEPVVWANKKEITVRGDENPCCGFFKSDYCTIPLYTHPHQWQGLTDDDVIEICSTWNELNGSSYADLCRAIEQALKEKNHG